MRSGHAVIVMSLLLVGIQVGPVRSCTSFVLDTPDGPFFGTNLDYFTGEGLVFVNQRGMAKEGMRETPNGRSAKWTSLYGSVTVNLVGREFAWGGMNEAGLVVSSMQLRASTLPDPDERIPFGMADWVQYVLDTCGTLQEVIALGQRIRIQDVGYPCHYLISDENGQCVAIEYLNGEFVYHTGDELPVKAMANAVYAAGPAYIEKSVFPELNPGASVERVAACAYFADRFDPDSDASPVAYALQVLTEAVVAPKKWWSGWFDEPYTRWSIVFDITGREVHIKTVENKGIKRISLDKFDLSCSAPLLMLDVNADLSGSVEKEFLPYDRDVNLRIFRNLCDELGIEVSKKDAIELMEFFDGFACAPKQDTGLSAGN